MNVDLDVDVIENGMPPERPRSRYRPILSRLGLAGLLVAGGVFAVTRHNDATTAATRPPATTPARSGAPPAPAIEEPVTEPPVDSRPLATLPPGLVDTATKRLAAPPDASQGSVELRGSNFLDGAGAIGLFDGSVTVGGTVRVDAVCIGTGLVSVGVQDGSAPDLGRGPMTQVDCRAGAVLPMDLTTAGKGFFVYAQLAPDTVAVLAYAVRLA